MKSLKTKIILIMTISVTSILVLLGVFLYYQTKNQNLNAMENMSKQIIQARGAEVGQWLQTKTNQVNILSGEEELKTDSIDQINQYVTKKGKELEKEFAFLWYGDLNGNFYASNGAKGNIRDRYDYKAIVDEGKDLFISNPVIAKATNKPVVVILHSVKDQNGKLKGVFAGVINLDTISEIAGEINVGQSGYGLITDGTGLVIAHPDEKIRMKLNVLESNKAGYQGLEEAGKALIAGEEQMKLITDSNGTDKFFIYAPVPNSPNWSLGVMIPQSDLLKGSYAIFKIISFSVGFLIILMLVFSYFFAQNLTRPIQTLALHLQRLAKGDFRTEIETRLTKRKDEIGTLVQSMQVMQKSVQEMISKVTKTTEEVNQQGFSLKEVVSEVRQGTGQIASTMQEMAVAAEEQANSSTRIANSIINLNSLIDQANLNGEHLKNTSNIILETADQGNEQMEYSELQMNKIHEIVKGSVDKVKGLGEQTQDISKLVSVIHDIANQTNLLSLNAAIEAARAGEAGKGFTVVAEEVRKLSEQVTNSISEITSIVQGIQTESRETIQALEDGYKQVEEGKGQIKITGQAFHHIYSEVKGFVADIERMSDHLKEIADHSNVISGSVDQVVATAQESSAGIEETSASIEELDSSMEVVGDNATSLSNLARDLESMINQFKI